MTNKVIVEKIFNNPIKLAHAVGFTKLTSLHNDWIWQMFPTGNKKDGTLQASRGTYKTTCVAFVLALIIVLLPNKRTMFMRKTDTDVKEVIRQVKNILMTRQFQALSFMLYKCSLYLTTDSAIEISTNLTTDIKGTSQLIGMGLGASLTGKHFDFIFTDDIVNIKDRISMAEREHTKIIYQELQNVKNRGGRIFNTGTPWHKDDCFSIMPEAEKYNCYHEEIKEIISDNELQEIKSKMTASLFAANYELRHIASEDVIFDNPQKGADDMYIEQAKYAHIDAAYGGEDFTAFTIGRKLNGKFYALGKLWKKHVDECIPEMIMLKQRYNVEKFICEKNADKGYLAKELRKQNQRAVTYHEDMNKFYKITTHLKGAWKDVIFVKGTDDSYIEQICDYNENAEHDDAPDSLASLIRKMFNKSEKQQVNERSENK